MSGVSVTPVGGPSSSRPGPMKARASVVLVAGARPNFMKVAPVYRALAARSRFALTLIHTGQHYDPELSEVFFRDLALPRPDVSLEVGSGSQGAQTARVLERFEGVLVERQPDLVIVFGDINSTVACALATAKAVYASGRRPQLAHVEAGLRSFDRAMPEEINRVLTDTISDLLFTTEESANLNLAREGIAADRVFFVGNAMIDTLLSQSERAAGLRVWEALGLRPRAYGVVTLHRPSNVDHGETLRSLLGTLRRAADRLPLVFPAHPRTMRRLREFGLDDQAMAESPLRVVPALGYLEFLSLMSRARLVLTDSGGIQEETTILGIPCLTLRENTERPITLSRGTNRLVGTDRRLILDAVAHIVAGARPAAHGPDLADGHTAAPAPDLWDGKAAERIADVLVERVRV